MKNQFEIIKNESPKQKPDPDKLSFGTQFTDHMFMMEYSTDKGWHNGRVLPYGDISLSPAAAVLHYGIEMFEGMKAYRTKDNKIQLFRPDMNIKRTNATNERICIPEIDPELMLDAIMTVVDVDRDWVPSKAGTSLYIRPFIIADEPYLGVRPANHYLFMIILCPVGAYYKTDASKSPVTMTKIFVEDYYSRAVPGGTGAAKIGANYVVSMKAQEKASAMGYNQVLWLDSIEKKYVQEIGTSNAFFVIDGEVITASLEDGTILPGITRDTILHLLKHWNIPHSERNLSVEDIFKAEKAGKLDEAFASGTAAVISAVGELRWKDQVIPVNNGQPGAIAERLYKEIVGIQTGELPDPFGWTVEV